MNVKTGEIRDEHRGDGVVDQHLHVDGWSPWLYHLPEQELDAYYRAANALMMRLERMPVAVRRRVEQVAIRCPVKGCLLATIYQLPRRATPDERRLNVELDELAQRTGLRDESRRRIRADVREQYLYVGRTPGGTEVYDILNYPAPTTPKDETRGCACCRILYWRAGCRHGTASLDRNRMYDMFSIAGRVLGSLRTEEQEIARLPEHLRPFWGKRIFHPAPEAWHPKKRSSRCANVPRDSISRARAAQGE